MVEYRELVDYPGYRFGDDGSVWSCWKPYSGISELTNIWNRLNPYTTKSGYYYLNIKYLGDRPHGRFLHNLVLEAFKGPRPGPLYVYECRHLDDNKKNNKIENLEWGTKFDNGQDRVKHGKAKTNIGVDKCNAEINDEIAIRIKWLLSIGMKPKWIADRLNISVYIIHNISRGFSWKHVQVPENYHLKFKI